MGIGRIFGRDHDIDEARYYAIGDDMKKRDAFKPWMQFRSAIDGRFVSRLYALLNPHTTVSERRKGNA